MWGAVLLLAVVATADPVRIGVAVLLMSRPRPMLNLLAFWIAGMATGIIAGLVVVFALGEHVIRAVEAMSTSGGNSSLIQIIAGALVMAFAVRLAVTHGRQAALPAGISDRVRGALQGGSLSPALVAGLGMATPLEYLAALVVIAASSATAASQVAAIVVYTLFAFAIAEIPLVSQLLAPARTQAAMTHVHDWVLLRRRQVLAVVLGVVGALLVTSGAGVF